MQLWGWIVCLPCCHLVSQSKPVGIVHHVITFDPVAGGFLFVAAHCGGIKAQSVFAVLGAHTTQIMGELECLVSR